ncbi:MAG: alpha/beta hydrolase, partial [Cyanobacteria bacterium J06598_3]
MKFKKLTPSHASAQQPSVLSKATRRFGLAMVPLVLALFSPVRLSPLLIEPSTAAERITFSLGATIERSISVESVEIYVKEGRITEELAPYMRYINQVDPNALAQARELLNQRADVDVTTLAQFAYTPQGEYFLNQVGEVFRTGARLPGGKGLRGAAIGAAADQETGLTVLNVIQRFPTPVLRVDLQRGLAIANKASDAFEQANLTLELVEQIAFQSAAEPLPPGQSAAVINQLVTRPGPYPVRRITVRLKAGVEPVDVYLPQSGGQVSGQVGSQV